jgi:hypothetical protein
MMVYFGPSEADSRFIAVNTLALKEQRFSFFWNDEPSCWEQHGVDGRTITFLTNFEQVGNKLHKYVGEANIPAISNWLVEPMIPPLV